MVLWRGGVAKVRHVSRVCLPYFFPTNAYYVHNADMSTVLHALLERVYYHKIDNKIEIPKIPSKETVKQHVCYWLDMFHRFLGPVTPQTPEEFVNSFKGGRKKRYSAALQTYTGYNSKEARLKTFVKFEKVLKDPPRVIQPRSPQYNICIGRFIKPLEHKLYRAINRVASWKFNDNLPVVMKGYDIVDVANFIVGKWNSLENPVAIGLDASRFDQHVSEPMLRAEHLLYYRVFKDRTLFKALCAQVHNVGYAYLDDGAVKYEVLGCRMSGDMNTALGNCTLMCAMVFGLFRECGITNARLINNGDDCVVFIEKRHQQLFVSQVTKYFDDLGFVMKVEQPVDVVERVSFCQMNPVFDGECWRMCRNPLSAIPKDLTFLKPIGNRALFERLCFTVGQCGASLTDGLPLFSEFYQWMQRVKHCRKVVDPTLEGGLQRESAMLHHKFQTTVTDVARVSFAAAFGITPNEQCNWEEWFRKAAEISTALENVVCVDW